MPSPVSLYQREMHENLGFFATWLPGDPIAVGDVGVLEGGRFRRLTTLQELGVSFAIETSEGQQKVEYTSTKGTTVNTSAGATAALVGRAEITIDFSREGAFLFHASRLVQQRFANPRAVSSAVVRVFQKGDWQKEWLLVEAVHEAPHATIIVSQDGSAGLTLRADIKGPVAAVSLADPKVGVEVASTRGTLVQIIGGRALHPLYSCLRLKDPLFGHTTLKPVRGTGEGAPEGSVVRPAIEELLDS